MDGVGAGLGVGRVNGAGGLPGVTPQRIDDGSPGHGDGIIAAPPGTLWRIATAATAAAATMPTAPGRVSDRLPHRPVGGGTVGLSSTPNEPACMSSNQLPCR